MFHLGLCSALGRRSNGNLLQNALTTKECRSRGNLPKKVVTKVAFWRLLLPRFLLRRNKQLANRMLEGLCETFKAVE